MTVYGSYTSWTLVAGAELSDKLPPTGHRFRAIALNDGLLATNGQEAGGLLIYGAPQGAHITIGCAGIMKFSAGAAITKGDPLTVNSQGYLITASSGTNIVGRCLDADVSSGGIGTGLFDFATTPKFA